MDRSGTVPVRIGAVDPLVVSARPMIAYPPQETMVYATDRVEFAVVAIAAALIILLLLKHWPLDRDT